MPYKDPVKNKVAIAEWHKQHPRYNHKSLTAWNHSPEGMEKKRVWLKTRRYGITLEQWEQMFIAQNGLCAICGDWLKFGKTTHTDHNPKTGKVRGLLCAHCNRGIGQLREEISILNSAVVYLKAGD